MTSQQKDNSVYWIAGICFILLVLIPLLVFNADNDELETSNLPISKDCSQLAKEAEINMTNCVLKGLENLYGIGYEPNLKDGGSCYFNIFDNYCLNDKTVQPYLEKMYSSCSKNFPNRDDVYAECLAKNG